MPLGQRGLLQECVLICHSYVTPLPGRCFWPCQGGPALESCWHYLKRYNYLAVGFRTHRSPFFFVLKPGTELETKHYIIFITSGSE